MSPISEWSALDSESRPTSEKPGLPSPSRPSRRAGDRPLPDRTGDHAGLAEPAAPGAATEDLDGIPLVHRLGQRHQRLLGYGQASRSMAVCLETRNGTPGVGAGTTPLDPAVGQVVDVVEARHVDPPVRASRSSSSSRPPGRPSRLPRPDDVGDLQDSLLAVAEHGGVDEVGDRLGVERGVSAGDHDGSSSAAVARVQRDAGQVERGEHVGVAELGGERDAEQVEVAAPAGAPSTVNCGTPARASAPPGRATRHTSARRARRAVR